LELRGNGIPAHKHSRAQTLQNLLFFLNFQIAYDSADFCR